MYISAWMEMFPKIGSQLGRFKLEQKLGEGSTGTVFLAHDGLLKTKVALRVLNPNLAQGEAFERNFQAELDAHVSPGVECFSLLRPLAELGVAGPARARYGHDPGLCVLAVDGPRPGTTLLETGSDDREVSVLLNTGSAGTFGADTAASWRTRFISCRTCAPPLISSAQSSTRTAFGSRSLR